ncbi:Transmembrane amino acid transporter protein [Tritrichomonas foetus]|uniref:Transmembrane amino acid transporter protein n=1 Tax=Tritrichomonas foetus TaxID=1144522 RepID=A0A1J4K6K1_9EUKA|nr:Transmembrane amino acid transporter protein [Tritrichomonas foetus]|eukprot:OHT05334.1 Transmembrane amino acid transporter protein [Tritrichomonas foetus]
MIPADTTVPLISESCDSLSFTDQITTVENKKYVSAFANFMNLLNLMHGSGMLTISSSFVDSGIWPSLIFFFFSAISCWLIAIMMMKIETKLNTDMFGEMVQLTLGKIGTIVLDIAIAIFCYGCLISYIIIGGNTVNSWLDLFEFKKTYWIEKIVTLSYALLIPVLFTIPRKLGFLSAFSTFSVFCLFVYVFVVYYEAIKILPRQGIAPTVDIGTPKIGILNAFSLYLLSFSLAAFVLPVLSVSEPVFKQRVISMSLSFLCCVTFVGSTGILGYLMYGADVEANLLESFDSSEPIIIFVRICFFFVISATYPVIAMTIEQTFSLDFFKEKDVNSLPNLKRNIILLIVNTPPVILGIFLPSIRPAMSIGGAFSGGLTNFIFPPLIWIKCSGQSKKHWTSIGCYIIVAFGVVVTVLCTYETVLDAIKQFTS